MERDRELFTNYDLGSETIPTFFFYTWDTPAITIGKIQRNREKLMSEAEALGVPCYLRPTGGRAVLHGGDICYTFIAAQSDPLYGGTLQESFKKVNQRVIALVNTWLPVIARSTEGATKQSITRNDDMNCFTTYVSGEGLYKGHKIIGAAQAMGSRSFIQQGSIQLNKVDVPLEYFKDQKTLSELTKIEYEIGELSKLLNK